jgi:Tfp pilus assembly pilus retraction ATPase PilT
LKEIEEEEAEDNAFDAENFVRNCRISFCKCNPFLAMTTDQVNSLTILPGTDKSGTPEQFDALIFEKSKITSIVGPTGSGKSRLLSRY